jgi:two-component system phosphate regulon sensor histidine kinase PhoR
METISFGTSTVAARPTTPAVASVGFNNSGRVAESHSDLCAALLAIASHDLRQPLQVIMGAHDILAKTLNSGVEQVQLARVEGATSKLSDKLDQLVDALRLFDPSSGGRREIVRLGPIFEQAEGEFLEAARLRGIRLRIIPTCAAVSSNAVLVRGILRNLIRNAIDYTPSGGHVLVAARRRGTTVRLEIRDNGLGIPVGELAEVFRPFHRVDTTRSDGLGLGLFIVKCAAAFLGHGVQVHSVLGRGSRFVVVANIAPIGTTVIGAS